MGSITTNRILAGIRVDLTESWNWPNMLQFTGESGPDSIAGVLRMAATNPRTLRIHSLREDDSLRQPREVAATAGSLEPFVPAQEAAKFIEISRRFLIELARRGIAGAYPIGTGELRKTWVFRLSELASAIDRTDRGSEEWPAESQRAYHPIIRRSPLK